MELSAQAKNFIFVEKKFISEAFPSSSLSVFIGDKLRSFLQVVCSPTLTS